MFLCLGLIALSGTVAGGVTAQESDDEGFPLGASAAYCDPGFLGPFVGCTPWDGVTVTFESADGTFNESCTTEAAGTSDDRAAGCGVDVPFGSTITASIDPSIVPAGFTLQNDPAQEFDIPDGPPTGLFGGPVFVLFADGDTGGNDTVTDEPAENDVVTDEPADDEVATDDQADDAVAVSALPETGSGTSAGITPSNGTSHLLVIMAALMVATGALRLARPIR